MTLSTTIDYETLVKCTVAKFRLNNDLMNKLRGTGNKELIYHSMSSSYYGCGSDGLGENIIGKLLMSIRANQIK